VKLNNINDGSKVHGIIAVGTPKRSVMEVIDSARKYVKVGNNQGKIMHIAVNSETLYH
jgi:hypothetical protein